MGWSRSLRGRLPRCVTSALFALLTACGAQEEPEPDAKALLPPSAWLRVVSLLPAASTIVLDLGAGSTRIAVDRESARLPELGLLPIVALEDVPGLHPDLVLVPALREADLWGPQRATEILQHHEAQQAELAQLLDRLGQVRVTPEELNNLALGEDRAYFES